MHPTRRETPSRFQRSRRVHCHCHCSPHCRCSRTSPALQAGPSQPSPPLSCPAFLSLSPYPHPRPYYPRRRRAGRGLRRAPGSPPAGRPSRARRDPAPRPTPAPRAPGRRGGPPAPGCAQSLPRRASDTCERGAIFATSPPGRRVPGRMRRSQTVASRAVSRYSRISHSAITAAVRPRPVLQCTATMPSPAASHTRKKRSTASRGSGRKRSIRTSSARKPASWKCALPSASPSPPRPSLHPHALPRGAGRAWCMAGCRAGRRS